MKQMLFSLVLSYVLIDQCCSQVSCNGFKCVTFSGLNDASIDLNGDWQSDTTECVNSMYRYTSTIHSGMHLCSDSSNNNWIFTDTLCDNSVGTMVARCKKTRKNMKRCTAEEWRIQDGNGGETAVTGVAIVFGDSDCPTTTTTTTTTSTPTALPSLHPTAVPTTSPSRNPITSTPTASPTSSPITSDPTIAFIPTSTPLTPEPTIAPISLDPTETPLTSNPTAAPVTLDPTASPVTLDPSTTPIANPSSAPITVHPTTLPTTANPSVPLTSSPSAAPVTRTPTIPPTITDTPDGSASGESYSDERAEANPNNSGVMDNLSLSVVTVVMASALCVFVVCAYFGRKRYIKKKKAQMEDIFGVQSFKNVAETGANTSGGTQQEGGMNWKNPLHTSVGGNANKNTSFGMEDGTDVTSPAAAPVPFTSSPPVPPAPPAPVNAARSRVRGISQPMAPAPDATRLRSRTQPAINAGRHVMYERWSNMFRSGQLRGGSQQRYFTNPQHAYGGTQAPPAQAQSPHGAHTLPLQNALSGECQLVSPRRPQSTAFPADIDANFVVGSPVAAQQVRMQYPMQHPVPPAPHHHMQYPMQPAVPPAPASQPHQQEEEEEEEEEDDEDIDLESDEESDSHHTHTQFDTQQSLFPALPRMRTEWIEHDIQMHHDPNHPQMNRVQTPADLDQEHEESESHHTFTRFDTQQSAFTSIPRLDTEYIAHDIDLQIIQDVNVEPHPSHHVNGAPQPELSVIHNAAMDNGGAEHARVDTVVSVLTDVTDISEMNLDLEKNLSFKD